MIETNSKKSESAEQDQTARMCSLILLYTPTQNISFFENSKTTLKKSSYSVPKKIVHFLMLNISKINRRFFCKFDMVSPKYTIHRSNIKPMPCWAEIIALYGNTQYSLICTCSPRRRYMSQEMCIDIILIPST